MSNLNSSQKWIKGCILKYNNEVAPEMQIPIPFEINYLRMNNDGRFDIDNAQMNFLINPNTVHSERELPTVDIENSIRLGKVEFKNQYQAKFTGNLFIEYEIDVKGDGNKVPSGLSTTEADWWMCHVDKLVYYLEVDFLKFCYSNMKELGIELLDMSENASSYIGYGFALPITKKKSLKKIKPKDIFELNNDFIQYKQECSLKKIRQSLPKK